MAKTPTLREEFNKGIWRENAIFIQMIGLCPALAITTTAANALTMGFAATFVLVASSMMVSSIRKLIPNQIRIATFILIISTFVMVVDYIVHASVPDIYVQIGAFIQLIVVNCIILARQEAFAAKNGVFASIADALGMGAGFTVAILCVGSIREILGSGTLFGISVLGQHFEPWVIMVLPPGGFFVLGAILLVLSYVKERQAKRALVTT